jgi:hypothetical protein
VAPNTAGHQRVQHIEYASSISSTETEKDDSVIWTLGLLCFIYNEFSKRQVDEELMLGSAMHARLEQLQREVMVVQEQQSKLATQRSEIAMEKELLARAIQDAEAQKKRYTGSKLQLQRENQKIDELKQQASCLFVNWCVGVIIRVLKLVGGPAVKLERKRNPLGIRSSKSTSSIEAIVAWEQKSSASNKRAESKPGKKGK